MMGYLFEKSSSSRARSQNLGSSYSHLKSKGMMTFLGKSPNSEVVNRLLDLFYEEFINYQLYFNRINIININLTSLKQSM
jgi:hypothetical protein